MIVEVLSPLRQFVENQRRVESDGDTVEELINNLSRKYPKLTEQILEEPSKLRDFITIFVNNEDIRNLKGLETKVKSGDHVLIMSAIAGG